MTSELASLGPDTVHVVVDMQRLFDEDTGWRVPTLSSIVPPIARLIEQSCSATSELRRVSVSSSCVRASNVLPPALGATLRARPDVRPGPAKTG